MVLLEQIAVGAANTLMLTSERPDNVRLRRQISPDKLLATELRIPASALLPLSWPRRPYQTLRVACPCRWWRARWRLREPSLQQCDLLGPRNGDDQPISRHRPPH